MKQEINNKITRETNLLIDNSIYNNTINFNDYPLFNNVIPQEHKNKISQAKEQYIKSYKRIINLKYDIQNLNNYNVYIPNHSKVLYNDDKNLYKIINKKPRYKDISTIQILKVLLSQHKINKYLYKSSIKIINQYQEIKQHNDLCLYYSFWDKSHLQEFKKLPQLKNKVSNLVSSYYKTIKSNKSKTTISALKRQQDKRTRININGYGVLLKKRYSDILENHTINQDKNNYSKDRLKLIYSVIQQEFNNKLTNDNKLL